MEHLTQCLNVLGGRYLRAGQRIESNGKKNIATMFLIIAVAAGLGVLGTLLFSVRVTRPLGQAVAVADAVALGDLSHRLNSESKDEVGILARALDRMSEGLRENARVAVAISKGDLTHDVEPASDKDEFGLALQ